MQIKKVVAFGKGGAHVVTDKKLLNEHVLVLSMDEAEYVLSRALYVDRIERLPSIILGVKIRKAVAFGKGGAHVVMDKKLLNEHVLVLSMDEAEYVLSRALAER